MEGKTSDADGLRRQMDRWIADLQPGATGYLGSTGGVTADGRAIVLARFESEEAARANSDRPEQGEWWAETEKLFEGPVTFTESSDIDLFLGGGSDDAGFVQIMKNPNADREELSKLDEGAEERVRKARPDLIGSIRLWTGPRSYIQAAYFTSVADARQAEDEGPAEEIEERYEEMQEAMSEVEFIDLEDPMLNSA